MFLGWQLLHQLADVFPQVVSLHLLWAFPASFQKRICHGMMAKNALVSFLAPNLSCEEDAPQKKKHILDVVKRHIDSHWVVNSTHWSDRVQYDLIWFDHVTNTKRYWGILRVTDCMATACSLEAIQKHPLADSAVPCPEAPTWQNDAGIAHREITWWV